MHWYTLTPFINQWIVQDLKSLNAGEGWLTDDPLSLNGHTIVSGLRKLLPNAIITLRGPFFCRKNTIYFPIPLHLRTQQTLVPIAWLPVQKKTNCADRPMLWDKRKPAPLVAIDQAQHSLNSEFNIGFNSELNSELNPETSNCFAVSPKSHPPFLSCSTILRLMENSLENLQSLLEGMQRDEPDEPPWTIETQWHHPIAETRDDKQPPASIEQRIRLNPGWKLAIALDDTTHQKLKQFGEVVLIRLGETQQFWLEAQNEPFRQQWEMLQEQSERNRKKAEQCLPHQPETARSLAYLVTPGVFERKQNGIATCRNFPWEWDLAYPADRNQPPGPLVSLATTHPVPIHCRCLSSVMTKDILAAQVFAVPSGSVYYLEHPTDLFQDCPFLAHGRPNKVHIWRQLGYSELLWMPYQICSSPPN